MSKINMIEGSFYLLLNNIGYISEKSKFRRGPSGDVPNDK